MEVDISDTDILNNDKKKRKREINEQLKKKLEERESEIENILFGGDSHSFIEKLGEEDIVNENYKSDHVLGISSEEILPLKKAKKNDEEKPKTIAAQPAWEDEDDEFDVPDVNISRKERLRKLRQSLDEQLISQNEYEKRLRDLHAKLNRQNLEWTKVEETETSYLDPLRSTENVSKKKDKTLLDPHHISLSQMRDANHAEVSKAVIQCCEFHRNGEMILTAGLDKTLRLFEIDGKKNPKLQSIHFKKFPITSARFTPDGKEVILSGTDKGFYIYDITTGNIDKVSHIIGQNERHLKKMLISPDNTLIVFLGEDGKIIIVSNQTKQWLKNLKMNGNVICACFTSDSRYLYSSGDRGEIYVWDLKTYRCIRRFKDEGGLKINAITISPDDDYLATGQESGVVNVYYMKDESFQNTNNPKPVKAIMNLTTPITSLKFNFDTQLLGICSIDKRNSFRLVHIPSMTVYNNWPKEQTPLGRVSSFDFSPDGGYLIIGNVRGNVRLFKIHHYHATSE